MGRIKLFSNKEDGIVFRDLICKDCGQVIHTAESPSQAFCPNCGGKRMDIKLFDKPTIVRKSLFEVTDERNDSPLESKLKVYSGKLVNSELYNKTFSEADSLLEKGYVEKIGDSYAISSDAYELEKLYSKLTISVTKTLELDPDIVNGNLDKESIIDNLSHNRSIPAKSIVLIRKAHGIPISPENDRSFSCCECEENWIEDSSIIPDLEYEYNNQSFGLSQFIKILKNRYPDAPENILDILVDKGVIFIEGNQVTIHKK